MARTPSTAAIPAARPGHPLRPERQPRPRLTLELLTRIVGRLTPRDRWLLHMLHEHRVLTTSQITQLAFGAATTAAHRMAALWQLRAVDRAQPFTPTGSAPMHYVLGDGGAAVLAAGHGITTAELGYRRDRALRIFHSATLAHTVGVNGFFAALVAHARTNPGSLLAEWWPEHRCAAIWGDLVRPDAYARWREHGRELDFFLEYDTGTETIRRVAAKLPGYTDLAEATGITTPVLFWFPTPAREAAARAALTGTPVPIATAAPVPTSASPAGRLWQISGCDGERHCLAGLAHLGRDSTSCEPATVPRPATAYLSASGSGSPVPPMPPGGTQE